MRPHQWIAIDRTTDSRVWAKETARAHEQALAGEDRPRNVREVISESWDRCKRLGFDPTTELAPIEISEEEASERWLSSSMGVCEPYLRELLADVGADAQVVLACDSDGTMLWIDGDDRMVGEAEELHALKGARWDEAGAGTNAMGTALANGHPLQVFCAEHFSSPIHGWTCSAAPVTDPETGETLGVLNLSGELSSAHPYGLALISVAARRAEAGLARHAAEGTARLRERYAGTLGRSQARPIALSSVAGNVIESRVPELTGERLLIPEQGGEVASKIGLQLYAEPVDIGGFLIWRALGERGGTRGESCEIRVLGSDRATVRSGDTTVELSPRQSEMLMVMALRPEGVSAEQLALELYGDFGKPVTARVEIARMRQKVGDLVTPANYRLTRPIIGDFFEVEELARSGRPRDALKRYVGPLLPQSKVPIVCEARQHLDDLVRTAVLNSSDPDLLSDWLDNPAGRDDVEACRRLAHLLPADDLRRPRALSRLRRLCGSAI